MFAVDMLTLTELPFEEGVDCFGKRYGERLVISYDKIYAK